MADQGEACFLIEMGTPTAHPLAKKVVRIGRDPSNEILIRDATVSRLHAEVRLFDETRSLAVVGSTGARVTDERVTTPMGLSAGARIEIGARTFVFHVGTLPPGISLYSGHGPDAQADPLLATTTVSNPVIPPVVASANATRSVLRWVGVAIAVALALGLAFCSYMPTLR